MTSRPRSALAAGITLAGIVLAGCGTSAAGQASAPASSGPASAGSASSAAPVSAPSVNPGGPMATAGGTAAGGSSAAECTARQLRIAYTDNAQIRNGALDGMSHHDNVVMFTNEGSASCQMRGYPGVAALNSAGAQIKQAVRSGASAPVVVLAPAQTASAMVSANSASCTTTTTVAGLVVTAPDQRTSTRLGPAGQFCLNSLSVLPVQPGNAAGLKL